MDADEALHREAKQRRSIAEIGQRRGHAAERAEQPGVPQHPVPQRPTLVAPPLVLGAADVALDADLRWAGDLAELAARTEIEARHHRRFLGQAESLRLWTERLRAAKEVRLPGDWANRIARGALGAGFQRRRFLDGVGAGFEFLDDHAANASCAAR
jgi:hypothetical protein